RRLITSVPFFPAGGRSDAILAFNHDMGVVMTADAASRRLDTGRNPGMDPGLDPGMDPSTTALTAEEYALFEQLGRPRLVAAGETLFRRGDLGTTMYVVVQGEIDLDFGD